MKGPHDYESDWQGAGPRKVLAHLSQTLCRPNRLSASRRAENGNAVETPKQGVVLNIIDMELRRGLIKLSSMVNESSLARDLQAVGSIPNEQISRRERERLFVRKAISYLPLNLRLIVFLKFWEGEDIEEIAKTMNLPIGQVRCEYLVALSYLEKALKPYILEANFFTKGKAAAV